MSTTLEAKFVNNCKAILDVMRNACRLVDSPPIEPGMFILIESVLSIMDAKGMIKYYANETWKYWDRIEANDADFICSNVDMILDSVNMDDQTRKSIKDVVGSSKMAKVVDIIKDNDVKLRHQGKQDEEDLPYIFEAMKALVKLSIKYTIAERKLNPKAVPNATYDLASYAANWNCN